jgi:hypothetical protein
MCVQAKSAKFDWTLLTVDMRQYFFTVSYTKVCYRVPHGRLVNYVTPSRDSSVGISKGYGTDRTASVV